MALNTEKIEGLIHQLLIEIGEDPQREGLVRTPHRVAKAMEFLTSGYQTDLTTLINDAIFTQETNSMVIVKDIELYSMCEHHMLPFYDATSATSPTAACLVSASSRDWLTCTRGGCRSRKR